MTNKTCGECKKCTNKKIIATCKHIGIVTGDIPACSKFEPRVVTNGDVIRQGGNKRLITFSTEWSCFHCAYHNGIERKCERPEGKDCFDGIEAWLNAPAESEGEDDN